MLKSLISNPRRQQFFNLLIFYTSFLWFRRFSSSVLAPHFLQQQLSFQQMIIGLVFLFIGAIFVQIFFNRLSVKTHWLLGILSFYISILLIIKIYNPFLYYLSSFFSGTALIFFFLPYNIVHFGLTPKNRTGFSSALILDK